jgi:cytochrome c556
LIPEVFRSDTHLADFDAKADVLSDAANALKSAAAEPDREAAIKAIVQVSAACNACHIAYTNSGK